MLLVIEREQLPVQEARAGKPAAWDILFKRYQLPLYVYVFELVHHEQASLDIVQETFINAARYIGGLREEGKFGSWLFGIAHQKCVQYWRKKRDEVSLDAEEFDVEIGYDEGPDDLLIRKEQEGEFMKLVEELAPAHRSVLLLHFVEEFSLEEIADIVGSTLGTVKSRMHYAKKALRRMIEERT